MTEMTYKGLSFEAEPAVAELAAEVDALEGTRAAFLKKAAVFGGGVAAVAAAAMAFPGGASASKASDVKILNFALTLEYLEATFYAIAASKGSLRGETKRFATTVRNHEIAHVKAIAQTIPQLGGKPVKKPKFNFPPSIFADERTFRQTALVLEEVGIGAYNGAGPALTLAPVKKAAASIVAVEALHAGWARRLVGDNAAPTSFDKALTADQVLAAAGPFIA